jgi:RimJ/RimL family protein N-acetyltransferase
VPGIDDSDEAFERWYGPWDPFSVDQIAELLHGFGAPWWIVGGHAIEAFTGVRRPHEDIDVALFRRDLPALRACLPPVYQAWSAGSGLLRPLDDDHPDPHPEAGQVWIREHALAPWKADFILMDERDGAWVWKHDPSVALALDESTWVDAAGVRYANPEIVLAHKARTLEGRHDADFRAAWPMLDARSRSWLRETIERRYPGHPWLSRMAAPADPVSRDGTTIRLREATLADAAIVDARGNDPVRMGEFNDLGQGPPRSLAENLAHGKRMVSPDRGQLLIERLDDGKVIGDVGWHVVSYGPDERSKALNIGISLDPDARGHGYGTEAQRLIARVLFDLYPVDRIEASTDVDNIAEQRSLEKAGFRREGVIRGAQWRAGARHDLIGFAVMREDIRDDPREDR